MTLPSSVIPALNSIESSDHMQKNVLHFGFQDVEAKMV